MLAQTALQSTQLELEYERILRRTDQIYDDERARILRIQLLLREDANDELREISEEHEDALMQSENSAKELQDRLADIEEQYENTQIELKACMRDIDQYQAEINALNASSDDHAKILTEKLTLSRELNALKPELDHLRTQVSRHDNILADKLSLERELATAQLELESEKRTVARLKQRSQSADPALSEELEELKSTLAKERKTIAKLERQNAKRANERSAADAALVDELETVKTELDQSRTRALIAEKRVQEAESKEAMSSSPDNAVLDELKKDLAKERKTAQRLEREQLKKATEWETQKETLESKLEAFRTKLRTTKEQLKEVQDDLERREAAKYAESTAATKARMRGTSVEPFIRGSIGVSASQANPKKRPIARFDPDMTIGTPGNGAQMGKRQRLTGSMLGDKSTFSITPFLNRTAMSVLPESPEDQNTEKNEFDKIDEVMNTSINEMAEEAEREQAEKEEEKQTLASKKITEKTTVPKSASATTADKKTKAPTAKPSSKKPGLAKVTEEAVDTQDQVEPQQGNITATGNKTADSSLPTTDTTDAALFQPKKKKLLGARRNIFDDDDDGDKVGVGKKKVGLVSGIGKVKLGPGLNKPKSLAVFSPLKKDRRVTGTVGA